MSDEPAQSHLERLGGEVVLRDIISDFIDRVTGDMMIGYLFRRVDIDRLKQFEFEFARGHLGGSGAYSGRPLSAAHRSHKILGGQFNRRLRLLQKTLADHQIDADVIEAWLAHNEALRSHITADGMTECND